MNSREPTRLTTPESSGVMPGGCGGPNNSYGHNLQNNPILMPASAGSMQSGVHLPFINMSSSTSRPAEDSSSMMYSGPGDGSLGMRPCGGLSMSEPVKKKRGRPRKYGPDGSTRPLFLMPPSPSGNSNTLSSEPTAKKRGRPLGSGKKHQLEALGSSGALFAPHIITVNAGEDIASKIMAFSQGAQTVCVISANGVICNVSLCQPATSGGTVTYEGLFEIISLSGSFLLMDDGCTRSRSGGLSVALADSEGRVLGGGVAGMLVAATPVQVVVGSFTADRNKPTKPNSVKNDDYFYSCSAPLHSAAGLGEGTCADSPPSQGTVSESSDGDEKGSPSNHSGGNCHNSSQLPVSSMSPPYTSLGWPEPVNFHHSRHDTDMKMMPN